MPQLYYKMRQLLQNATFVTNCDSALLNEVTLLKNTLHFRRFGYNFIEDYSIDISISRYF